MNLNKLKGFLVEKGYTYKMCADVLGISVTSFSNKMNNKNRFYLEELNRLGNATGMTKEEKVDFFLG